jgi:hypothetical protein
MRSTDPAPRTPAWRLRGLLAIVVIMAVLAAGWPLVNASISDTQPLAAGRTLTIGPDFEHSARITVGRGWSLLTSGSNPQQYYQLRRAGTDLGVSYVTLLQSAPDGKLWSGLGRIVLIGNASARLGAPRAVRSSQGISGLTGRLTQNGRTGIGAIYPGPGGKFAIEMTALPRAGAPAADLAAARRVIRSVMFPEVRR